MGLNSTNVFKFLYPFPPHKYPDSIPEYYKNVPEILLDPFPISPYIKPTDFLIIGVK
jgi:hypothetical protein